MKVAIVIPTLGRPQKLEPLLNNIRDTTPRGGFQVFFVAEPDDRSTIDELLRIGAVFLLNRKGGLAAGTNVGFRASDQQEFVLPTADDVVFHDGWYEAVIDAFQDPQVQVVGTDDTTPATENRDHATMPVVRRSYVLDPGAVWGEKGRLFFEGYHHGWVETELWQLAEHRGVTAWAEGAVIEHLHPDWGTREPDATDLKGNMQGKAADLALFESRRAQWLAA